MHAGSKLSDYESVLALNSTTYSTHPFSHIIRMHNGILSMHKPKMNRAALMTDGMIVDGVEFTFDMLHNIIENMYHKASMTLHELLRGFQPADVQVPSAMDLGKTPFMAFGKHANSADGNQDFVSYITSNNIRLQEFFNSQRNIKQGNAKDY
jgi:hypothetical protein